MSTPAVVYPMRPRSLELAELLERDALEGEVFAVWFEDFVATEQARLELRTLLDR